MCRGGNAAEDRKEQANATVSIFTLVTCDKSPIFNKDRDTTNEIKK